MEDLTSERHNCLRYSCAEGCGIFQRGKFSAVLILIETNRFNRLIGLCQIMCKEKGSKSIDHWLRKLKLSEDPVSKLGCH